MCRAVEFPGHQSIVGMIDHPDEDHGWDGGGLSLKLERVGEYPGHCLRPCRVHEIKKLLRHIIKETLR